MAFRHQSRFTSCAWDRTPSNNEQGYLRSRIIAAGGGACAADADQSVAVVASRHLVGELGDNAGPSGCKRITDGNRSAELVELVTVDLANRLLLPAVLPRREVGGDLATEGLVHLDDLEVIEFQPGTGEHAWHGDAGSHEETIFGADSGELDRLDEGERLLSVFPRSGLGHQHYGRGAVGEGTRVACSEGSLVGGVEHGWKLRQLLHRRARSDDRVRGDTVEGVDLGRQPAVFGGSRGVHVAEVCDLVLLAPGDVPLLDRDFSVLSHRHAG